MSNPKIKTITLNGITYDIGESGSGSSGADWSAKEGQDGFIKNKPFDTAEETIEPVYDGELAFTELTSEYTNVKFYNEGQIPFKLGDTVELKIDDTILGRFELVDISEQFGHEAIGYSTINDDDKQVGQLAFVCIDDPTYATYCTFRYVTTNPPEIEYEHLYVSALTTVNTKLSGDKIQIDGESIVSDNGVLKAVGGSGSGGADWNAVEDEDGFIENKPFDVPSIYSLSSDHVTPEKLDDDNLYLYQFYVLAEDEPMPMIKAGDVVTGNLSDKIIFSGEVSIIQPWNKLGIANIHGTGQPGDYYLIFEYGEEVSAVSGVYILDTEDPDLTTFTVSFGVVSKLPLSKVNIEVDNTLKNSGNLIGSNDFVWRAEEGQGYDYKVSLFIKPIADTALVSVSITPKWNEGSGTVSLYFNENSIPGISEYLMSVLKSSAVGSHDFASCVLPISLVHDTNRQDTVGTGWCDISANLGYDSADFQLQIKYVLTDKPYSTPHTFTGVLALDNAE